MKIMCINKMKKYKIKTLWQDLWEGFIFFCCFIHVHDRDAMDGGNPSKQLNNLTFIMKSS